MSEEVADESRSPAQPADEDITVDVTNIGGIDRKSVSFNPGITILAGRNATNRTSFLQALMAALGSDEVSLKADAEEGHVALTLNGETYERHLERQGDTVVAEGSPYLDDPKVADQFAFLLESNEARRAVERGDDLRDIIMEPVDTAKIESEIRQLENEKQEVDEELATLDDLETRTAELHQRREELAEEIEDVEAELEAKNEEIATIDASIEGTTERQQQLEAKLEELRSTRSDLEDVKYDLETARESLADYEDEREAVETELESLDSPEVDISAIEAELSSLHDRKQQLTDEMNRLGNLIQFNEEQLQNASSGVLEDLQTETDAQGALTDQLAPEAEDEEVVCWTCGSTVKDSHIEATLEQLRELRQERFQRRQELDAEIDDLRSKKQAAERSRQRRQNLEADREQLTRRIEDTRDRIDSLEERRDELDARVEALESEAEELREEEQSELLDLHEEANQLEFRLRRLQDDHEAVEDELAETEDRLDERDQLEDRREEISEALEELRSKVERIEKSAIETFNEKMEQVLDRLEYENIERVWIERKEASVKEGRRKVSKSTFNLHVVRLSESGTVYEDTLDHLSESEREVIGLVFALAGFLTHEVYEKVPFMLLDSLEALDSERIATLIEYLGEYSDNLVVALLREDAEAVPSQHERVTEI